MSRLTILSCVAVIAAIVMIQVSQNSGDRDSTIVVLCAPSLSGPMEELKHAFSRSELNADGIRVENTYRGSAELLAMYKISQIGDMLIAADVDYHEDFVAAGLCESAQPISQQHPCLIYREITEEQALSILTAKATSITVSVPKPNHAAVGNRVALIFGNDQYDSLVDRAKVSRETVSQVAADVSSGIVDVGIAWSTTPNQFSNLKSIVPPGWPNHSSEIGSSLFIESPKREVAARYQEFLASSEAQEIFTKHGFSPLVQRRAQ